VIIASKISQFFEESLDGLKCQSDTKAYLIGLYSSYQLAQNDLSKESITLYYSKAKNNQDFVSYQRLGDWLFYCATVFPQSLSNASPEYYQSIGRLSYYACYRLLQRQWLCYEELADRMIYLEGQIKYLLSQSMAPTTPPEISLSYTHHK